MSSVLRSIRNSKPTSSFYVNEGYVSDGLLDEGGVPFRNYSSINMAQRAGAVTINDMPTFTTVACNAIRVGWLPADNQFAYSSATYTSDQYIAIEFTCTDPSYYDDYIIGFADAANTNPSGAMYNIFYGGSNTSNGFYFWQKSWPANTKFKIVYDGKGKVMRYINGSLYSSDSIDFADAFPNGLKVFAVFNNGERGDHQYSVNISVTAPFPPRTFLFRNMGKQFVSSGKTYLKVQNVADDRIFYINFSSKDFASYNL